MKTLVIGLGSIGRRHSRILQEMGHDVACVSKDGAQSHGSIYRTVPAALASTDPDYVVVANRTHEHRQTLIELRNAGYNGLVFIEKPIFDTPVVLPGSVVRNVVVGYNLRFHPIIENLREALRFESVITAQIYAGQYLPDWRERAYQHSYSAKRAEGGGALRDLSHELDTALHLFGRWERVAAIGGQYSSLAVDSDDAFGLLVATNRCPIVCIQVNYLNRTRRREIIVNTDRHTYVADLIRNTLQTDGQERHIPCPDDQTYRAEHQAALEGDVTALCAAEEGLETLRLIVAAEQSSREQKWVTR